MALLTVIEASFSLYVRLEGLKRRQSHSGINLNHEMHLFTERIHSDVTFIDSLTTRVAGNK